MPTDTKSPGEKTLSVSLDQDADAQAARRDRRGAPELQPWPLQGRGGREGEAPRRRTGRGQGARAAPARRAGSRRDAAPRRRRCARRERPSRHRRRPPRRRRSRPAFCCARSPRKSRTGAPTRSATPRCARPRNARSPRKRRRSAPSATRSNAPSARPPRRASAPKKIAAATTRKPSARPTKSPRSASAARKRQPRPQENHHDDGVYDGAIGFGIGAVKCGTCCPARRPSEQRVPCALPEPRTLPDHRSGRTRHGIVRRYDFSNVFRIGCEWLLIPRAPARKR